MKADALLLVTGAVSDVPFAEEVRKALDAKAYELLRSGVTLSMAEYGLLSVESLGAFRIAQERIDAERAESVADVIVGRVEAALASVADESANAAAKGLLELVDK